MQIYCIIRPYLKFILGNSQQMRSKGSCGEYCCLRGVVLIRESFWLLEVFGGDFYIENLAGGQCRKSNRSQHCYSVDNCSKLVYNFNRVGQLPNGVTVYFGPYVYVAALPAEGHCWFIAETGIAFDPQIHMSAVDSQAVNRVVELHLPL